MTTTDRFLKLPDTKAIVGIGRSQIYELIRLGEFPQPYKVGRTSLWSERELYAWIQSVKDASSASR